MSYFLPRKSESSEGLKSQTEVHINDLNDDCIVEIFNHLTDPLDLHNLKSVCQKWRDLCPYAWRKKKKIEIRNYFDVEFFKEVTSFLCRKNVTHLILNNYSYSKHEKEMNLYLEFLISTISSYENVQHLYFSNLFQSNLESSKIVKKFLSNIPTSNLSYFEVFEWNGLTDDVLAPFLSAATGLTALLLNGTSNLKGHSLMQLSNKCTHLGISWFNLDKQVTINIFKKLSNLEKLKVEGTTDISLDMLHHLPNLIYLDASTSCIFNACNSDLDTSQFNVPPFLKLKILKFQGNDYVNGNKLLAFTKLFPNLEELNISECFPGSEEGVDEVEEKFDFGPLAKFECLKILKCDCLINDLDDSLPSVSEKFKALEVLDYGFETDLTETELLWMVNLCPTLRIIKLGCAYEMRYSKMSQLVDILKIIHPRVINFFLRITIDYRLKEVVERELQDYHPNLHLITKKRKNGTEDEVFFYVK